MKFEEIRVGSLILAENVSFLDEHEVKEYARVIYEAKIWGMTVK